MSAMKTWYLVSNMKYSFLLLFICAVQRVLSEHYDELMVLPKSQLMLGSIRDLNSGLPKCIGAFVTSNTLVTSARCLFCDRDCKMIVHIYDSDEATTPKYNIKSIKLHENYEMDPHRNDIGLVWLDQSVPDSAVVELHDQKTEATSLPAYSFTGKFLNEQYYLKSDRVDVLTNAKCTFALHNYIPESQVCAYSANKYYFQEQDQGSPLVYFLNGKAYLLGMYVRGNFEFEQGAKIAIYKTIVPYANWIDKNAKNKTDVTNCTKHMIQNSDSQITTVGYAEPEPEATGGTAE